MMTFDNEKNIDWSNPLINFKNIIVPPKKSIEPKVDEIVSKIVGKKIYTHDPRLIKLVVKWRKRKSIDEDDNFLKNPYFIKELKETLKGNL